jgi:hypothetical protein
MKKIHRSVYGLLAALVWLPSSAAFAKFEAPEPLKPWVGWVLKGREDQLCPFFNGGQARTLCRWSSPLALSLDDKKGAFSLQAKSFTEGWIPLPGDADHWPQDVKAGGNSLAVVLKDGRPQIFTDKGAYGITGSFSWDSLPQSLAIPSEIGVVRLSVRGSPVAKVTRDDDGRLWLESKPVEESERDQVSVRVHRLVTDDVPLTMTTRVTLEVSGKTRDFFLPSPLPTGFIPMSLESPLPAQFQQGEQGGRIKVQVKAGTWDVELKARHQGPVTEFVAPPSDFGDEVWAFEARNDLRLVNVTGVPAVDPNQTTLPDDWKSYPAYRMKPGDKMAFEEKRRGDSDPQPDQLSLNRDLWLDFDGRGFTLRDAISGTMAKSSRLETQRTLKLGHVAINGPGGPKDQLITSLGEGREGIEIREGQVSVSADSRIEGRRWKIPATGWAHVFQSVSETLHLPPGWRAFAVIGADSVPETWVNRWTLLEIFLVLVAALSFGKLWGRKWGLIALLGLGLTVTETGAPLWAWIAVLAGLALLRFLPEGRLRKLVRIYWFLSLLVLVVFAVPFLVDQARMGLYPSLEEVEAFPMPAGGMAKAEYGLATSAVPPPPPQEAPAPQALEEAEKTVEQQVERAPKIEGRQMLMKKMPSSLLNEYQPGAKVQTGPGLPEWSWRSVEINWFGPVEEGEGLRLLLIPPCANMVLSFARVLLMALLIVCVLDLPEDRRPRLLRWFASSKATASAVVLMALAMIFAPSRAHAEFPSADLLQELQNRLLEKPVCYPNCASISRMRLEATPSALTLRLEVHVDALSAVPLPGVAKEWTPSEVAVDGAAGAKLVAVKTKGKENAPVAAMPPSGGAALTRSEDGRLWVELDPGVHQVLMTGPLPDRQNVQIPLPLKPYFVEAKADGWSVTGLHEDGLADDNLQLMRSQVSAETSPAHAEAGALPAFLRIERRIVLGLTWEVETHVMRVTPVGTAVVVQVPLIVGESVTTPGYRVNEGKVVVNLAPQATEASWRSTLLESATIPLKAEDSTDWTEVWTVEVSPIWHVQMQGIPVVRHYDSGAWLPTFQPWPGEEAKLEILRPEAVEGQTLTIERSRLSLKPGFRSTEADLTLTARSSLGGQHAVTLPKGAELQSVSINGGLQTVGQVGDTVTLPIVPGEQNFEIKWNGPQGIGEFFRAPQVGLGIASVNASMEVAIPQRWVLFVGGPRLGPAVLFWGLVVVLLLASMGLGRVTLTPLKTRHWFLLGLGLTQVPVWASIFVALWLLALGWRKSRDGGSNFFFDLHQLLLAALTIAALVVIVFSIERGLLGIPVMQIEGNGSTDSLLLWFQDRIPPLMPRPWVVTLPMYVYRAAMLAWALWLAFALLKWLKWGWECYTAGGLWRPLRSR